jgi:hypothetical protein
MLDLTSGGICKDDREYSAAEYVEKEKEKKEKENKGEKKG